MQSKESRLTRRAVLAGSGALAIGGGLAAVLGAGGRTPVGASTTIETRSADREANMWAFTRAALELLERCVGEANTA